MFTILLHTPKIELSPGSSLFFTLVDSSQQTFYNQHQIRSTRVSQLDLSGHRIELPTMQPQRSPAVAIDIAYMATCGKIKVIRLSWHLKLLWSEFLRPWNYKGNDSEEPQEPPNMS
jgi:hypothetical protein